MIYLKNIWDKIQHNKLLFTIFMLVSFFLFEFIVHGFYGYMIPGFGGIMDWIRRVILTTETGSSLFSEIIIIIILLPVLVLFGNTYIFTQKKVDMKNRWKLIWPMVLEIVIISIFGFFGAGGFKYPNYDEIFAGIVLFFFVGIFEEFLCRGWLLNEFLERFSKDKKGILFSLIMSSLVFGVMHVTNIITMGQSVSQTIVQIVMATFMGMGLGSIYLRTNNIWTVVLLHGFYDMALTFSGMNATTSCFAHSADMGVAILLVGIPINLLLTAPAWLCFYDVIAEDTMDKVTGDNYKAKISTIKPILIVKIVAVVLITGYFGIVSIAGTFAPDQCVKYSSFEVDKYTFISSNQDKYNLVLTEQTVQEKCMTINDNEKIPGELDITQDGQPQTKCISEPLVVKYEFDISFNDKGVIVKNDDKEYVLELENVTNIIALERDGKILIAALVSYPDGNEVYYTDYLSVDNLKGKDFKKKFKKSFEQLYIPSISLMRIINIDDVNYLSFQGNYRNYYYMDKDNNIKLLEFK